MPEGVHPDTNLGKLAVNIYDQELGFHDHGQTRNTEITLLSGWLEGHLGELNALIFSSFSGDNPSGLMLEEQAILREMYLSEYNRKAERNALRKMDGDGSTAGWIMIQEGDSVIKKPNIPTPKFYHEAYKVSQEKLKELVYAYNLYGAKPKQVVGDDAPVEN
jgi:hypothetical protein